MFHIVFGPAMAIMSRLRFGLKLGLVGLLFLAPLVGSSSHCMGNSTPKFAPPKQNGLALNSLCLRGWWCKDSLITAAQAALP